MISILGETMAFNINYRDSRASEEVADAEKGDSEERLVKAVYDC
jgi:hypothetical protein